MGAASRISVVVLTFNEELNLAACLESVSSWTAGVFVVDSGSTDATASIARRFGAQLVMHPFATHAQQWEWSLANLPIETDWVLGLDADQRVTPELRQALVSALQEPEVDLVDGFFVSRRQIFRGTWIRHGGYYPKYMLKVFRRRAVRLDPTELVDHHFHVDGRVRKLRGDIIEDNQNEARIAVWTDKHNRYAALQARQDLAALQSAPQKPVSGLFWSPDTRTRWLKQVWRRMPLYVRPCLYVFYRYVIRFGFLDGKQGFIFHVLQAFWYRLLVDINNDELRSTLTQTPRMGDPGLSGRADSAT